MPRWPGGPGGDKWVDDDKLFEKFLENTERVKHIITPVRTDSVSASKNYQDNSLDFVFIDGDHSYEACKADILAWLPKMKNGSILAGHDYG
jgi:predicted O-methyltransferase YrrM